VKRHLEGERRTTFRSGRAHEGQLLEVLLALHALHASELTSFGGPIAHLGYFRDEMSMCVSVSYGPASSQVAIAIGIGLVPGCPTL
jgi:hypothetical protein